MAPLGPPRPALGTLTIMVVAGFALAGCGRGDQVLARVGTQTITARDLQRAEARASRGAGSAETPQPRQVFGALVSRALLLEAAHDLHRAGKLGTPDSLPEGGHSARRIKVEKAWLDSVYRVEVLDRVADPNAIALRTEWTRRHPLPELIAAQIVTVSLADTSQVRLLRANLRGGRELTVAGKMLSPRPRTDTLSLRFPIADTLWRRFDPTIVSMRPNQIRGPLRIAGRWTFIEALSHQFRSMSFDSCSSTELANLRLDALESAREARFGALVDSLASAKQPEIFADRLDRVRPPEESSPAVPALAWAFALSLSLGLGAHLAGRRVQNEATGLRKLGHGAIQIGLTGLLLTMGCQYLVHDRRTGWDFENCYRSAREMRAGMSPYAPETVAIDAWDPATPFLYAPITLWLFRPLVGLPLERALVVWLWITAGLAVVLGAIYWRLLPTRVPLFLLGLVFFYGFNGAVLLDLRTANVSLLETVLLWSAFVAFLADRRWLCSVLIAVGALFKLLPIVFLGLLAWPTGNRIPRARPVLAGLGLFGLLLALPSIAGAPWARGFLHNLEGTRAFGEVNPSALGLMDVLLTRGKDDPGRYHVAVVLWVVYCIALLLVSASGLRRAWRRGERTEAITVTVMLFILLSPRPIVYGYALAVVPALLIVLRFWPGRLGVFVGILALSAQGLVLRGVFHADFIAKSTPWPALVVLSNLPFLTALGLWLVYIRAPEPALPTLGSQRDGGGRAAQFL